MTPDELKAMPKGSFIVAKTGVHPMKVKLRLFPRLGHPVWESHMRCRRRHSGLWLMQISRSWKNPSSAATMELWLRSRRRMPAAVGGMNHGMQAEKKFP